MTWGGPRIRNELAKLSIDVAVSTVAKYMSRRRRAPSPTWRAFLENHMKDLVVPTASFGVLFGLVVLNGTRCHLSLDGDAPELSRRSEAGVGRGARASQRWASATPLRLRTAPAARA